MRLASLFIALGVLSATSAARADDDSYVVRDMHMRSAPLFGSGVALASLGGLAIPVGAFIVSLPHTQLDCKGCGFDYSSQDRMGVAFLAGGLAAVAAGVPMIIWGVHRVPVAIAPSGPLGSSGVTLAVKF